MANIVSRIKNVFVKIQEAHLVYQIKKINIEKAISEELIIDNPTDLIFVKADKKKAIFLIDDTRCVIYFGKHGKAQKEFVALQAGEKLGVTPHAYGYSSNYVVLDWISAPTVAEYLETNSITKDLTQRLLQLLAQFKEAGYLRIDHALKDIYIMPDDKLKVMNVSHQFTPLKLYPTRMIQGMGSDVELFLHYVKEIQPSLLDQWANHPDFLGFIEKVKKRNKK